MSTPANAGRPRRALVVNVVGSAEPFFELVDEEMERTLRKAGLTGRDLEAAMRLHRTAPRYVPGDIGFDPGPSRT